MNPPCFCPSYNERRSVTTTTHSIQEMFKIIILLSNQFQVLCSMRLHQSQLWAYSSLQIIERDRGTNELHSILVLREWSALCIILRT